MTKIEYENAMSDAQGDADVMLGACVQRIKSLEKLADWAETILCNVLPMPHCTQTELDAVVKRWRDEKHGVNTIDNVPPTPVSSGQKEEG